MYVCRHVDGCEYMCVYYTCICAHVHTHVVIEWKWHGDVFGRLESALLNRNENHGMEYWGAVSHHPWFSSLISSVNGRGSQKTKTKAKTSTYWHLGNMPATSILPESPLGLPSWWLQGADPDQGNSGPPSRSPPCDTSAERINTSMSNNWDCGGAMCLDNSGK